MSIKGIIFDINGTLIDIHTNEWHDEVYRVISNLLSYQGVMLDPDRVREVYFQIIKEQLAASAQRHPEFDATEVFRTLMAWHRTDFTRALPPQQQQLLPVLLAQVHRAAARFRLQLYPGVRETIIELHSRYALSIVSDAQTAYAAPELNAVGLSGYFDPVIISGELGFRKPDVRIFEAALGAMKLTPQEVLFVGNDLYRDVYGPQKLGIRTVFFKSSEMKQDKENVAADYIIYSFPELLNAVRFFEANDH